MSSSTRPGASWRGGTSRSIPDGKGADRRRVIRDRICRERLEVAVVLLPAWAPSWRATVQGAAARRTIARPPWSTPTEPKRAIRRIKIRLIFVTSEVSLNLSEGETAPETRVLAETLVGEVTTADLVVVDDGLASEVVLAPDQTTFYSVSQHRYVTTVEGAATVVHLFGPIVDPEGREPTMISLSLVAQG